MFVSTSTAMAATVRADRSRAMRLDGSTGAFNSRRMSINSGRRSKSQATLAAGVSDSRHSGPAVQDRRVERTQRALREALIRLVLERGWDDVSVQDVCARANVGRSTFYLHFADKEELLVSGFGGLQEALRA